MYHALLFGALGDLLGTGMRDRELRDLLAHEHHFVHAHAALVALARAPLAADGTLERERILIEALDLPVREALLDELVARWLVLLRALADASREALGERTQ